MWVVLYAAFFIIGLILSYIAFDQYRKTQNLLATGTKTNATVIDLIASRGDDGTMYSPVFEFTDRSNTKRTFKSGISSRPAAYNIGEKVKVVYNPKGHDEVKTISFWGLYRGSVILFMIAAPFLIIGGSYLLYSRG